MIVLSKDDVLTLCDDRRHKAGNYFRTVEEAREAAEEVGKTLEAFHERKEGER